MLIFFIIFDKFFKAISEQKLKYMPGARLLGRSGKISSIPSLIDVVKYYKLYSFNECNKLALVLDLKIKSSHNMYIAMLSMY